jgi:hypothetical protein
MGDVVRRARFARYAGEFAQQLVVVRFVVAVSAGVEGRVDAG